MCHMLEHHAWQQENEHGKSDAGYGLYDQTRGAVVEGLESHEARAGHDSIAFEHHRDQQLKVDHVLERLWSLWQQRTHLQNLDKIECRIMRMG